MNHASCSTQAIAQPAMSFRLIPAGKFRALDGRPQGLDGWVMDGIAARNIIAALSGRKNDVLIDYEHQSIAAGIEAPAAGWFKSLSWREGDGLYVTDARWTRKAAAMLTNREYRYISPVFQYEKETGRVLSIISAAITNNPALDGLTDLAAATRKTCAPPGINAKDLATMKHVFGPNVFEQAAAMDAHDAACSVPLAGTSPRDHIKMQEAFGKDYAIRARALQAQEGQM